MNAKLDECTTCFLILLKDPNSSNNYYLLNKNKKNLTLILFTDSVYFP